MFGGPSPMAIMRFRILPRSAFLAIVVVSAALDLRPAFAREDLVIAARARVAEAIDGDTVRLDDGREVRLVGIQAPKLALGRKNFKEWPLGEESKAALSRLSVGRVLELRHGGASGDRHGRILAHLFRDDGLWVQGEMLKAGMARVYTFPDNRARAAEMYALEREARDAKRGIWAHPFYAVRGPDRLGREIGTFQVVSGTVLDVGRAKNIVFLNFGADWRSDFTIRIDGKAQRLFRAAKFDLDSLKGRAVEVRGWLKLENGPMIDATHPEQIVAR